MADNATDRALVTFVVIAYNQERYVREAVEAAFAQTYEPLEIILSDDCSSDRTHAIMEEMALNYEGPHKIKVRRNPSNRGVVNHLMAIVEEANSDYLVLAAGDDVSLPGRTKILAQIIQNPAYVAACSSINEIDENGYVIGKSNFMVTEYMRKYSKKSEFQILVAPSAAYKKQLLLDALMTINESRASMKLQTEDFLLWLYIIGINGRIGKFEGHPLVNYRIHEDSLSAVQMKKLSIIDEKKWLLKEARMFKINMEKQIAAMEMFRKMPQAHHWIEEATIADGVDRARFLVLMTAPRLTDRIKSLVLCRTFKDFRAALLRLPGVHAAAMVRWMFS